MMQDTDILPTIIGVIGGLLMTTVGLRMLINPDSITENSVMYRFMLRRYFQFLDREVAKTRILQRKHIRIYGLLMATSGVAGVVWVVIGTS